MNVHHIGGRVGQDPELQQLPSGTTVCNASIATDDPYKDSDGNFRTKPTWHRVTLFGRQAETFAQHVRKGRYVVVTGTIRKRKNEETGVVYVDTVASRWEFGGSENGGSRNNGGNGGHNGNRNNGNRRTRGRGGQPSRGRGQPQPHGGQGGYNDDLDDDIPF